MSIKAHTRGPVQTGKHATLGDKLEERRASALAAATNPELVDLEEGDEDDLLADLTAKPPESLEE